MNLIVLGVIFLSLRNLSPYVILDFKPSSSRGPDDGLGKGGLYDAVLRAAVDKSKVQRIITSTPIAKLCPIRSVMSEVQTFR